LNDWNVWNGPLYPLAIERLGDSYYCLMPVASRQLKLPVASRLLSCLSPIRG
jgi:hypothetical protein